MQLSSVMTHAGSAAQQRALQSAMWWAFSQAGVITDFIVCNNVGVWYHTD